MPGSGVPYYSQWESPELVGRIVSGRMRAADDPRWAESGARTPQEYEYWSGRVCGLACLKMILAYRCLPVPPMMRLVQRALSFGAYVPDGERMIGLIYRPFADWVEQDYGIGAEVVADLSPADIAAIACPAAPVIVSVHHSIRWPDRTPPHRGGHLVLVTGAGDDHVRIHNPSGLPATSQQDAHVQMPDFARFFAGRGLVIRG